MGAHRIQDNRSMRVSLTLLQLRQILSYSASLYPIEILYLVLGSGPGAHTTHRYEWDRRQVGSRSLYFKSRARLPSFHIYSALGDADTPENPTFLSPELHKEFQPPPKRTLSPFLLIFNVPLSMSSLLPLCQPYGRLPALTPADRITHRALCPGYQDRSSGPL